MSDVIGRGIIEVSADSTKLKAGIDEAKRSIKGLGDANTAASASATRSIDRYIQRLQVQQRTLGMSTREAELYRLALRGATQAQLEAADAALRLTEAHQRGGRIGDAIKTGLMAAAAAAAVVAGTVASMVISSINAADALNDLSKTSGISVEQLSGLSLAAEQSGTDLEGVAAAISKLSQNIGKDGEKFKALGITAKDPLEAFKQLADIFAAVEDPQTRAALGAAALGKSWQSAAPLLASGGQSIGEMVEKGMKLSNVTQQMANDADEFNDNLAELKATSAGFGAKLAGEMLPAFNDIAKAMKTAYEDSGKLAALWTGMGALGAFLFTDEFSSDKVKLEGVNKELKSLQSIQKDMQGTGSVMQFIYGDNAERDAKVKGLIAQKAALEKAMLPKQAPAPKAPPDPKLTAGVAGFINEPKDGPKVKDTATQEAKSQLAFDLDQIKKASDGVISTFANAERIMDARRSAGLINEHDYYASKLGFINLNSEAQEKALQQEITRLESEKLTGKDKIDNARKIADVQAKLDKVRAGKAVDIEANSIAEVAANTKIAQSYIDAAKAAEAYINTISKQNARELGGVGRGDKFRSDQAGRSAIEDKQTTQRQGLEGDLRRGQIDQTQFDTYLTTATDTYAKELQAYDAHLVAMKESQGSWANGASEAFANYQANAENVAGNSSAMFGNAFQGMTDGVSSSISQAIIYGDNFGESMKNVALSVADAFISSFLKIQIQKMFIDKTVAGAYATTIAAQSQAMVAMAGLNAFAATAAIPIVGPVLAPAAAATAIAIAEGFAISATAAAALSVASAEGGYDIPAGVNPLTQLHEKEMVLPAQQADVIRDLAKNGGGGGSGGGNAPVTIVNQTTGRIDKVQQTTLSNGERALIIQESVEGSIKAHAAQLGDPNSPTRRAMHRHLNVQGTR